MEKQNKNINVIRLLLALFISPALGLGVIGLFFGIFDIENIFKSIAVFIFAGSFLAYPVMITFGLVMMLVLESRRNVSLRKKYLFYTLGGTVPGFFTLILFFTSGLPSILTLVSIFSGIVITLISCAIMNFKT